MAFSTESSGDGAGRSWTPADVGVCSSVCLWAFKGKRRASPCRTGGTDATLHLHTGGATLVLQAQFKQDASVTAANYF